MPGAAEAFEEYAKRAPAGNAAPAQSAADVFEARAAGKLPDEALPGYRAPPPTIGQSMYDMQVDRDQGGGGEVLANMVTGTAAAVPAGLRGLWHLLTQDSTTDINEAMATAAQKVNQTQEALTYRPRDPLEAAAAQAGGEVMGAPGQFVGRTAQDIGAPPWLSASLEAGTDVFGPQALFKGLKAGAGKVAPLLERAPTEPVMDPQNMGAAAAHIDTSRFSPPLQQAVEIAKREGPLNHEVLERHADADTLPIPVRLTWGEALRDPAMISREQNMRAKDPQRAKFYQERDQSLRDNLDEIRAQTGPTVVHRDHVQNGQALVDAYKEMDAPIRADISAKYKALEEANGGTMPISGKSFVDAADAALAKKFKTKRLPAEIRSELDDIREEGSLSFQRFEELRTSLATDARKAERSGDGNAAIAIRVVRDALESIPMEGEAAGLKKLADSARAAAKARFDRLEADPAYRAAAEDKTPIGEPSTEADTFVRKYVINGKGANLQRMRENLAANEEAGQTIAVSALNYLKDSSEGKAKSGNFSQAGYNSALNHLSPRLQYLLPETVAAQAQQLGRVANYTQFQPRGSFVNNSNTFVAAAGEGAKSALEGMVNMKMGGVPGGTFVRKKLEGKAEAKEWERAIAPGAGVRLSDLLKVGKDKAKK